MKKILITGASGFVGSFLVEEALLRGWEVHAGIRRTSSKEYLKDPRIHFFYLDFFDTDALVQQLEEKKFDYIIQNAGVTKAQDDERYYKVNVDALTNLVDCIHRSGTMVEKFIFVSSLAAYGPADGRAEKIVKNDSVPRPVTTYGLSKLRAEKELKKHPDLPYTIIRPTAVYGPREQDLLTLYKMLNNRIELLIGKDIQKLTFIYVKDLARAILDLCLSPIHHAEYFVSDGSHYSAEELNELIKNLLNKRTLKLRLPLSMIKIIAILSEKISSLSGNYPALNLEKVKELKCHSWLCDIQPIKEDIGFISQYSLEDGMKETINWYKAKNIL